MKIAHINNMSGVSTTIADEQRKVGHHVDVFTFNKISHLHFGGEKFNYYSPFSRIKFFKTINKYDLWHYHHPYGSLKKKIEKKVNNKIYIKHYHGDDIRGQNDNDMCIVSTPDLLQFTPNGFWLPNPLDLEFLDKYKNNGTTNIDPRKINIAHYPFYKIQKKNRPDVEKDLAEILNEVSKKYNCKIVNILKLPYHVAIARLSQCDIVIGKILNKIGWFGKLELEGMFLGKSIIAYISDHLFDKYKPPVYRTTSKTFIQDLETLIEDYSIRKKLANEGPTFVKSNHSKQYVMSLLDKYYEKFDDKK